MIYLRRIVLLSLLVTLPGLAGCNLPQSPQPAPSITVPPILVITDTPAAAPPTPVSPSEVDLEFIQITAPGPGSRVTSPLVVTGFSLPTFEQTVVIQLTDMNGDVIALQPATLQADLGEAGPFEVSLTFNVTEEQPGRVSVYYASPRDGGLVHLTSAHVTLLPEGAVVIEAAASEDETIQIDYPDPLAVFPGGIVPFSGTSEYFFEAALVVAICGEGGNGPLDQICGTQDNLLALIPVTMDSPDIGLPGTFAGELLVTVSQETPARLVVYSTSPMDGGLVHLTSVEIILRP